MFSLKHAADRVYPWSNKLDKALVRARYRFCWRIAKIARRVLDAGCGYGLQYKDLPRDIHVVALDIDFNALKYVRKSCSLPNIDLVRACLQMIPFREKSVNVTLLMDVIEHIPRRDVASVLHEVKRITRLLIILSTPNRAQCRGNISHMHEYTVPELLRTLRKARLRVVAVFGQVQCMRVALSTLLPVLSMFNALFRRCRRYNVEILSDHDVEKLFSEDELALFLGCEPYHPSLLRDYAHVVVVATLHDEGKVS